MESETRSTIATPLAIVGFGMASFGYLAKHPPSSWIMAAAYGSLTMGMLRNLQEEAGLGDLFPNIFSTAGYLLAAAGIVTGSPHALPVAAIFLWNGIVHALLWKKQLSRQAARITSMSGALALLGYYIMMSYTLMEKNDTGLLFASMTILAIYYGITLGINVHRLD